jgi:hypothetical protein
MAVKITSNTKDLQEIIENFKSFSKTTLPILVRRHARLLAVELANRTQPFSLGSGGKDANKLGKNAVDNDVKKIFRDKQSMQIVIDKTIDEKLKEKLQSLLNAGKLEAIGKIFKSVGMINESRIVAKAEKPQLHKQHRSPTSGRSYSPPKEMLISLTGMPGYIKEVQKRVGHSKAGWADCARRIGGVAGDPERGIPAFAKSKKHTAQGSIIDGTHASNPFIIMTNNVPWTSRILPEREQLAAIARVREKMVKQAQIMTSKAAKNNFNPEPADNE